VSTSKNEVNYVVTEYGVARLDGKSTKQRALELISIAHPNFRPELTETAKKMKLI
jgi:acyl-CoA hydrolase